MSFEFFPEARKSAVTARRRRQRQQAARNRRLQLESLEDRRLLAANLWTDLQDYVPGSTAHISGSGFAPGEPVQLQVLHTDQALNTGSGHAPWIVTDGGAGDLDQKADGKIETTWYVNPDDSLGASFQLTASGLNSGEVATTAFTDATITISTNTNWSSLSVGTGDTITVEGGATLTIDTATAAVGNIQLGGAASAGALKFNAGSVLAVSGNVTIGSTNTGTLDMTSGGTLKIGGAFTKPNGTFTPGSGTVEYNGIGAQTIAALNHNNLTISGARTTNSVTLAPSGTIGIAGTFTASATFSTGVYEITGSTIDYNGTGAQVVTAFNYNHLTISGARTTNRVTFAASGTLGVAGNFTAAASFTTGGSYVTTGSTLDFNGTAPQTLASGGASFNKVTHSGAVTLQLSAALTTTGTFTNSAGTLDLNSQTTSLATLSLTGGTIQGGTITSSNAYDLQAGTVSAILAGAVGLTKTTSGTVILSGANTYSGATTINQGTLTLSGASGSAVNSAFTVAAGSSLTLDNSSVNNTNRLGDAVALTLAGGELVFKGSNTASTNAAETVGALTLPSGASTVTVMAGSGGTTILTFAGANRTAGATALFRGNSLGATPAAYVANLVFTTATGLSLTGGNTSQFNKSIVRWAVGDTLANGTGTGFVTHNINPGTVFTANTTGIRPLDSNEYATSAITGANINASGLSTNTSWTFNSLLLSSASPYNIGSTSTTRRTITITSGAVFSAASVSPIITFSTSTSTNRLALGTEGNVFVGTGGTLTVGASITGTAVTKSGAGILTLSKANSFTGTLTIDAGTLRYGVANAIASGGVVVGPAGTYDLNGYSDTIGALTLSSGTSSGAVVTTGTVTTNTLTLGGNVTLNVSGTGAAGATLGGNGKLALGATRTITVNAGSAAADLTISAIISGSGFGITKSGAGKLALTGINTYSGTTTISQGTVSAASVVVSGSASNLGNATTAVVLGGTSTSGILSYTGSTATYTRGFTLNAGGGELDVTASLQTLTVATGAITAGGLLTIGGAGNTSISSVISGAGGLTKTGSGTLTLSGSNTYTGNTTITQGTVSAIKIVVSGSNSNFGNAASAVILGGTSTAGVLSYTGPVAIYTRGFTIGAGGGEVDSTTNLLTIGTGGIAGTSGGLLTVGGAANVTITSILSHDGGLTKTGAGTLLLSGANWYVGDTAISQGTLKLGASGVIPDGLGHGNVSVTGTLDLGGFNEAVNGLSGAGTVTSSTGPGTATLTVGNNDSTSAFSGVIQNATGSVALTKVGSGTLTLSGTNTYTGATAVTAGTLVVTGATAAGSAVSVASGGTFAGTGSVQGTLSVVSGGTLAPGAATGQAGTLRAGNVTTGSVTLASGATFAVDLLDQLDVTGTINLNSATLALTPAFTPAISDQFAIVANDGTDAVTGKLKDTYGTTLNQGDVVTVGGRRFQISYVGGTGNDVVLTYLGTVLVSFTTLSSSGSEGTSPALLTVDLSAASPETVTVHYAVLVSASPPAATGGGVDYTLNSGILTFPPNSIRQTIDISIVDDLTEEPAETITVDLSSPTNATLGPYLEHTYSILDNDSAGGSTIYVWDGGGSDANWATKENWLAD
ncbi:MAG: autotransporter-associated beta strand repeat-containing protein, partial [Planctomycetota bacterium]|nr:autotransporter-associated beta strand repeat-containing protein [Planctomycetota bacterium]